MSSNEPEWEVLPPEEKENKTAVAPLFRWLALIMDDLLRIPGTRFRFGLDPLVGLLPGIGDTASAITSALALIYAARRGLPKILLVRMAANILINELVGMIPGIGDAFSFWFKSNARNYKLLESYSAAPRRSRKSDWIFVIAILVLLMIIVCGGIIISFFVIIEISRILSGNVQPPASLMRRL